MRFDDNRSILRRIIELPYVLLNMRRYIFSTQFLVYFLRSVQIVRMLFIIIVYLLLPFDLIPENVVGIIGYIDDFLIAILILGLFVAFIAAEFMRNRNRNWFFTSFTDLFYDEINDLYQQYDIIVCKFLSFFNKI